MSRQRPRMGRIEYLNVLPIYHALETGRVRHGYEMVYGPPAILNLKMNKGELATASTSSIEYARHPELYWLVPDLAIGCKGPVMSVLLMSRRPLDKLAGGTILVSEQTHTSAALLRLLLRERFSAPPTFITGDVTAIVSHTPLPDAILAIGDEALRLRNHPAFPHILDLGAAWQEWTGLPFIFGLWVISKKAAKENLLTEDPAWLLQAGRDWGAANMQTILDIAEANYSLSREEAATYFNGLSFTLGDVEQKGLLHFYERLAEAGEIASVPKLAFWPGTAGVQ